MAAECRTEGALLELCVCPPLCRVVLLLVRGVLPIGVVYPYHQVVVDVDVLVMVHVLSRSPCSHVMLPSQCPR